MKQFLTKYWEFVVEIGTSPHNSIVVNKQIRIINTLSIIGILSYLFFAITYAFDGIGITSIEAVIADFALMFVIYLNYKSRYTFAKYFHHIFMVLMLTFLATIHGAEDGADWWIFVTSIVALMYFDKKLSLALLFLFNVFCFWTVKYIQSITGPLVYDGNQLYNANLTQSFFVIFLIAYYFKSANRRHESELELQKENLIFEKEKSESLLTNILPEEVAEELKTTGSNIPQFFDHTTVIFTDFKDFTQASQSMSPSDLIKEVNRYFSAFDDIIQRYNIEKIKTIGDAYMCVGGVPIANQTNPEDAVLAALEMQDYVQKRKVACSKAGQFFFEMRVGIHTGPVIAGVIGKSKFAYDIWGDTVNTAARMETACEVGCINISEFTFQYIQEKFNIRSRGRIEAKHKGLMEMYYVDGKKETSDNKV